MLVSKGVWSDIDRQRLGHVRAHGGCPIPIVTGSEHDPDGHFEWLFPFGRRGPWNLG